MSTALLSVSHLRVRYGAAEAVRDVSFEVAEGQVVAILGSNGAGKTTTLKAVSGLDELQKSVEGQIVFDGRDITNWPAARIARAGVVQVPEGRRVFAASSVEDNLLLGAYRRRREGLGALRGELAAMYERFPVLGERRRQSAGLLSGGEQQLLAIGRALMAKPRLLLFDEPSLGLAPMLVAQVFRTIAALAAEGITLVIVEQLAARALAVADHAYVLETGEVAASGPAAELASDPAIKAAYLGG